MNSRDRVFAMLDGRPVDRLPRMPITMLFAARQYGVKYGDYAADHRVMVDAQIRTSDQFGFDHVSGISDPAREASDVGGSVAWFEDQPPALVEEGSLLEDKSRLSKLHVPDPLGGGRMHDRVKAMTLFKERVGDRKIIEGWVEGPGNQGANLRGINRLMLDFHDDPGFVRELVAFIVEMEVKFGTAQIEAGADIIGMGDPVASLAGPRVYEEFLGPGEKAIIDGLHAAGARVRLHICGNSRKILKGMAHVGADIIDLDSLTPIHEARSACGADQVLLGNIDPVRMLCEGPADSIRSAMEECKRQAGPKYMIGAGCEVPRDTPVEHLRAMLGD
ncbi:MAG: uroporphyrinogen decarboxylase family protein [Bryobacteraceae bacterium]